MPAAPGHQAVDASMGIAPLPRPMQPHRQQLRQQPSLHRLATHPKQVEKTYRFYPKPRATPAPFERASLVCALPPCRVHPWHPPSMGGSWTCLWTTATPPQPLDCGYLLSLLLPLLFLIAAQEWVLYALEAVLRAHHEHVCASAHDQAQGPGLRWFKQSTQIFWVSQVLRAVV